MVPAVRARIPRPARQVTLPLSAITQMRVGLLLAEDTEPVTRASCRRVRWNGVLDTVSGHNPASLCLGHKKTTLLSAPATGEQGMCLVRQPGSQRDTGKSQAGWVRRGRPPRANVKASCQDDEAAGWNGPVTGPLHGGQLPPEAHWDLQGRGMSWSSPPATSPRSGAVCYCSAAKQSLAARRAPSKDQ